MWQLITTISWITNEVCFALVAAYSLWRLGCDVRSFPQPEFKRTSLCFTAGMVFACLFGMYIIDILAKTWIPTLLLFGWSGLIARTIRVRG